MTMQLMPVKRAKVDVETEADEQTPDTE